MPSKIYEVEFDGDASDKLEGFVASLGVYGSVTLYNVRVKKTSVLGAPGLMNIDCGSVTGKTLSPAGILVDIDPTCLESVLTDGDTIVDIPNLIDGSDILGPSGDRPEWMEDGDNVDGPTIDFLTNGGDERLELPSPVPSFATGEAFSIAILVDNGNTNANRPFLGSDVGAGSNASRYGNGSNRNMMVQDESGNSFASTSGGGDNFKNKDIHVMVRNTSNRVSCYRRGEEIISGESLTGTFSPSIIGNAREGSSWGGQKANITRVLIAEGEWTDQERQDVEGWLAYGYGLQTAGSGYLPSGHLWKDTDPTTPKTNAFTTPIDLSGLVANVYSGNLTPDVTTISGPIKIYMDKVYKIGTVTVEITVTF